jgi:hypothetical protein
MIGRARETASCLGSIVCMQSLKLLSSSAQSNSNSNTCREGIGKSKTVVTLIVQGITLQILPKKAEEENVSARHPLALQMPDRRNAKTLILRTS